jgi:hypothetical protein
VGEINRVYLYTKVPLTPEQEAMCLADIGAQAREGFRIELQREVFAHTAEETFVFLVKRIEPSNKFYGLVDSDTEFEIIHEEAKATIASPKVSSCASEKSLDEPLLLTEVGRLKPFIDELEALRNKYVISWGCLRRLAEAIDEFGRETAPCL